MGDETPTTPIPLDASEKIVRAILAKLPPDARAMPIGGTAMGLLGARVSGTTKDVDLVVVLVKGGEVKIPRYAELVEIAKRLVDDQKKVETRDDQTSAAVQFVSDLGVVKVEIVCGRGASGGYFVKRRVLEGLLPYAQLDDRIYRLPLECLAFLKAWAATDKAKLAAAGKDLRGYHGERERAFRRDVKDILDVLRKRGAPPDTQMLNEILALAGKQREKLVRAAMRAAGWPI